jgi:hypothetical protein
MKEIVDCNQTDIRTSRLTDDGRSVVSIPFEEALESACH